jgi:hypothetical protein
MDQRWPPRRWRPGKNTCRLGCSPTIQTQAEQPKRIGESANVAKRSRLRSDGPLSSSNLSCRAGSAAMPTRPLFENPTDRFGVDLVRGVSLTSSFNIPFDLGSVRCVQFPQPLTFLRARQECLLSRYPFRGVKQSREQILSYAASVSRWPKEAGFSLAIGGQIGHPRKSCDQAWRAGGIWMHSFVGGVRLRSIRAPGRSVRSKVASPERASRGSNEGVTSSRTFGFDTTCRPGATALSARVCSPAVRVRSGSQSEGSGHAGCD